MPPHTAEGTGGGVGDEGHPRALRSLLPQSFPGVTHAPRGPARPAPRPGLCGQVRGPRVGASHLCVAVRCPDLCLRSPGSCFPGRGGGGEAREGGGYLDGTWSAMGNLGGFLIFKASLLLAFHMLMPSGLSVWGSERLRVTSCPPTGLGGQGGGGKGNAVASSAMCHHIMPRNSRMEKSEFPWLFPELN